MQLFAPANVQLVLSAVGVQSINNLLSFFIAEKYKQFQ